MKEWAHLQDVCVFLCLTVNKLLTKGQICQPCYIKKKGNTGMRTRKYWWVSSSLMTAKKITPVLWVRTWKKTVENDRVGIKHLTLKFRGPLGLGGMNEWWKNELLKEHWPKSWMCSSHVVVVCYRCWNQSRRVSEEESRSALLEKYARKRRGRGSDTQPFMLPGEVTLAEWHQSFSWTKTILALNNNLKFFLSTTKLMNIFGFIRFSLNILYVRLIP